MKRAAVALCAVFVFAVSVVFVGFGYSSGSLRGHLDSGVAYSTLGSTDLVVKGNHLVVSTEAEGGAVGGNFTIDVAPGEAECDPFPVRISMGWVKWVKPYWSGKAWIIHGVLNKAGYPRLVIDLTANPTTHEAKVVVDTSSGAWGWQTWVLDGALE